jgi:hypothetical protein
MADIDSSTGSIAAEAANGLNPAGDLHQEIQSLRTLVVGALMALLMLSVAVNVFLWRQTVLVRDELANVRKIANGLAAEFEKKAVLINTFLTGLREYTKDHPDFAPILQKYNVPPGRSAPTNGPIPSLGPVPAGTTN